VKRHQTVAPLFSGPAAWNEILPSAGPTTRVEGDVQVDVAVIGGGFAGLSAAERLRQLMPDCSIAVVEAGRIGQGASGRNSGFMIDLPHDLASDDYAGSGDDKAQIKLNRMAQAFARDAVERYDIEQEFFDPAGKINGAASPEANARNASYAAHLAGLGEPSEMLDAQQMTEITGSRHYTGGLYTPGTIMLQPAGYVRGLAAGLGREGVRIFEDSPVHALTHRGQKWQLDAARGRVDARQVILAVNGLLERFGYARGRLMHLFLYASMTPDLDDDAVARLGGADKWGVTPSDPMGTTVRRVHLANGGHRIVTRTCATLRSGMSALARDLRRATSIQCRKFDQRFPQLAGLKPEYQWAGQLCLTLNGVAVAGQLDDGLYSACVQNGLGTARGTLTGICAAELATGHTSLITEHFTGEPKPRFLPPRPLRDPAANALLRWREWKAQEE